MHVNRGGVHLYACCRFLGHPWRVAERMSTKTTLWWSKMRSAHVPQEQRAPCSVWAAHSLKIHPYKDRQFLIGDVFFGWATPAHAQCAHLPISGTVKPLSCFIEVNSLDKSCFSWSDHSSCSTSVTEPQASHQHGNYYPVVTTGGSSEAVNHHHSGKQGGATSYSSYRSTQG